MPADVQDYQTALDRFAHELGPLHEWPLALRRVQLVFDHVDERLR